MSNISIKKNTVFNIFKACLSVVFPLITFPYISRVLLPENVGKVTFSLNIVNYFSLLASLGITVYAIRECARVRENREELSKVASQIFSINFCLTILSYVLLLVALLFVPSLRAYRLIIAIQSVNILFATLGADWLNSAMEDFQYITIRTFVVQLLSLIAMFVFVKKGTDYLFYAIIGVVAASGANIMNMAYRKRFCTVRFTRHMDWKHHFPPIFQLFVMQLAQVVFTSADTTMLGLIHGDYEVGLYTAAIRVYNIVSQLMSSILWVVMPRLSLHYVKKDYKQINGLLRKVLCFIIALGMPCVVGVSLLAPEIMMIIGGVEYLDAAPALRILMVALSASLMGGSFIGNVILLTSKREKPYLIACSITAVVNVILNAVLIPFFGIYAAAITTAVSSLLLLALLVPKVEKEVDLGNFKSILLLPILGCGLIVVIWFACQMLLGNLWIRSAVTVAVSIVAYGGILLLGKYEMARSLIMSILNRIRKAK